MRSEASLGLLNIGQSMIIAAAVSILMILAAANLLSQPIAIVQNVLTLDRCLALAAEHSPQLHMAENAIRSAQLSLDELKTTVLPQLKGVA